MKKPFLLASRISVPNGKTLKRLDQRRIVFINETWAKDQHDADAGLVPKRNASEGQGAAWALEDRELSGLGAKGFGADIEVGGYSHHG